MTQGVPDNARKVRNILHEYLNTFARYSDAIKDPSPDVLQSIQTELQRQEPLVTTYLIKIVGNSYFNLPRGSAVTDVRGVMSSAIMSGNNADPINFFDLWKPPVISLLNRAIGSIDADLWPPKESNPVLIIRDIELRERCHDLLQAPGKFDRVIRESTTILEDRIRNKTGHEVLSRLIPLSKNQTGEKLLNALFSPKRPVLLYSTDEHERLAFFRMILGTFSYLRNPHHHKLDDKTEWSWAWSTVGLIDRLLTDLESCELMTYAEEKEDE